MNKEKYETPVTEITKFATEDVITTSGGNNGDPNELPAFPVA